MKPLTLILPLILSHAALAQDPATKREIDRLADSAKSAGLPLAPLYAKVNEGKLKQATDAQILAAVRSLARRLGEVRSALGSMDESAMTAAATALSAGVTLKDLQSVHAGAGADFAIAVVTITDLISQRAAAEPAVSAVQQLLARHAGAEQYARLRSDVANDIVSGRAPDQSIRTRTEAILQSLRPPEP